MAYTTVDKSTANFKPIEYTGNGSSNAISTVGFKPDWVILKDQGSAYSAYKYDSIRGATKRLLTDSATTEGTLAEGLKTFDTNGFTMGTDNGANDNSGTITALSWLAGGTAPSLTYKVVVVSDSGNKYRFRNSADNATFGASAVTLDLQEGGTYTFDVSDSTMNSHPFVIGTAANSSEYSTGVTYKLDGVTKTYSQYTSGFSAATTRQLIITVPASAPALYYWCSQHSGMGGAINTNSLHGSSNFDGTIQSVVSNNSNAGFSIVKWAGDDNEASTVGHGLGSKVNMIYTQEINGGDWNRVWQTGMTGDAYNIFTNNTNTERAAVSDGHVKNLDNTLNFGFESSTSNVAAVNQSGINNIAYVFKSVPGFSRFGVYQLVNNNDNTFVYTGFRPSMLLIKNLDDVEKWYFTDTAQKLYNPHGAGDFCAINAAESNSTATSGVNATIDLLSNGFKVRATNTSSGEIGFGTRKYLFWAFGQSLVGSNNVPATAR